jgi:hypothetical protein
MEANGCKAGMDRRDRDEIAAAYRRFAEEEARGRSALYEALARGVADDPAAIGFLLTLPRGKRQPNLLFAAFRLLFGTPAGWDAFRCGVLERQDALRAAMLAHAMQTNEPGRCAVLLPVLARLPGPLALIEVGASAGLCLLPDHYGYDYGGGRILQPEAGRQDAGRLGAAPPPVFPCAVDAATPVPAALPRIAWRAGLYLDPLDLGDPGRVAWLEALVWPEQAERLARLRAAVAIAAAARPRVVRGDLRRDLTALVREAPRGVPRASCSTRRCWATSRRTRRGMNSRGRCGRCATSGSRTSPRACSPTSRRAGGEGPRGRFLLAVDGVPVGWADPHGAALDWIGDPPGLLR